MKKLITVLLLIMIGVVSVGCVSANIQTDRDRVASAALTYESAIDGLTTARQSGLLDDDAYRKIDPVVDTAYAMLQALKARVDAGENVTDETLDRIDLLLDAILDVLLSNGVSAQSRIDEVQNMKLEIQTMRAV